jgi:hypothetical protein
MKVENIKTEVKQELLMPEPVLTATALPDTLPFLRYSTITNN